jgi:hypothetical protein
MRYIRSKGLAAKVLADFRKLGISEVRGTVRDLRGGHGVVIERKRPTSHNNVCMLVPGII